MIHLTGLDHIVLTVTNMDATVDFYTRVLGMELIEADGRKALRFGSQKINLHPAQIRPEAKMLLFLRDLVRRQAMLVKGTEGAAFFIKHADGDSVVLDRVAHIREDKSNITTRREAITAFEKICRQCVEEKKDGAIQIEGSWDGKTHQFCLVVRVQYESIACVVTAIIVRAADLDAAREQLRLIKLLAVANAPLLPVDYDSPVQPHAKTPRPGSTDLCLLSETPLPSIMDHLRQCDVTVELGPVERSGAAGPIHSIYLRDPDGNLIELSNLKPTHGNRP